MKPKMLDESFAMTRGERGRLIQVLSYLFTMLITLACILQVAGMVGGVK